MKSYDPKRRVWRRRSGFKSAVEPTGWLGVLATYGSVRMASKAASSGSRNHVNRLTWPVRRIDAGSEVRKAAALRLSLRQRVRVQKEEG
jgi:hypothetical protein